MIFFFKVAPEVPYGAGAASKHWDVRRILGAIGWMHNAINSSDNIGARVKSLYNELITV